HKSHPALMWVAAIAALSMAGIPPFLGFVANETIMQAAVASGAWRSHAHAIGALAGGPSFWVSVCTWASRAIVVVGSVWTVAYTARFMWATFADKKIHTDDGIMPVPPTPVLRGFGRVGIFPAAVLSALGLLFGMSPAWAGRLPYAFGQTFEPV